MDQLNAIQAIMLLGGPTAAAKKIKNASGNAITKQNLRKAVHQPAGVPDWLASQLKDLVAAEAVAFSDACKKWARGLK